MATILISLDDLKAGADARNAKETADKSALKAMFDTTQNGIVEKLHTWAGLGFPVTYVLLSTPLSPPSVCLDGVVRNFPDYVTYLLGHGIEEDLAGLQAQVAGIALGWSMPVGQVQVVVTGQ